MLEGLERLGIVLVWCGVVGVSGLVWSGLVWSGLTRSFVRRFSVLIFFLFFLFISFRSYSSTNVDDDDDDECSLQGWQIFKAFVADDSILFLEGGGCVCYIYIYIYICGIR